MDNDENILIRLKRKNLNAYRELFLKYHGRLVLFANKFTGDIQVSQDLVQDAFMKLWENPDILKNTKSPKAYLFQSVRNNCRNYQRHLDIKHSAEEELAFEIDTFEKEAFLNFKDPLHSLYEIEMEQEIEKIIQSLPDKCQKVFKMSRRDHMKNAEIARELGISVKMVEKHISKALTIMRYRLSNFLGTVLFLFFRKNENPDVSD